MPYPRSPFLEDLVTTFLATSESVRHQPLTWALRRVVVERSYLIAPLLESHSAMPQFWDAAVRFVVPPYPKIRADCEDALARLSNASESDRRAISESYANEVLDVLETRQAEYRHVLATKRLQMSRPERAAFLRIGLASLADDFGDKSPVVVELGTSAGLLLSELAATHPDVETVGVDPNPLRLDRDEELRWFLAHLDEAHRPGFWNSEMGRSISRNKSQPPLMIEGSGMGGVEAAIRHLDTTRPDLGGRPLVLFHSMTALFMDPDEQEELAAFPGRRNGRECFRISAEMPRFVHNTVPVTSDQPYRRIARENDGNVLLVSVHRPDGSQRAVGAGATSGIGLTSFGAQPWSRSQVTSTLR